MNQQDWQASIERAGVVVGCVVRRDDTYLLVKENPAGKTVYNLPAGHVDAGEQLEDAAIREVREETGYEVALRGQIGLYHETAPQSVKHVYEAEIIGGAERPQPEEILEVVWKTFEEISLLEAAGELRAPWVFDVLSKYHVKSVNGHVLHDRIPGRQDYLFRTSLKSVIFNDEGEVLVVKETGRHWWDLPGGGMDHGESIKDALARELHEEVTLTDDFNYRIIDVEDPNYLSSHNFYQLRLVFLVQTTQRDFRAGEDGDEIMYADPRSFKDSELEAERLVYRYAQLAKSI